MLSNENKLTYIVFETNKVLVMYACTPHILFSVCISITGGSKISAVNYKQQKYPKIKKLSKQNLITWPNLTHKESNAVTGVMVYVGLAKYDSRIDWWRSSLVCRALSTIIGNWCM